MLGFGVRPSVPLFMAHTTVPLSYGRRQMVALGMNYLQHVSCDSGKHKRGIRTVIYARRQSHNSNTNKD